MGIITMHSLPLHIVNRNTADCFNLCNVGTDLIRAVMECEPKVNAKMNRSQVFEAPV